MRRQIFYGWISAQEQDRSGAKGVTRSRQVCQVCCRTTPGRTPGRHTEAQNHSRWTGATAQRLGARPGPASARLGWLVDGAVARRWHVGGAGPRPVPQPLRRLPEQSAPDVRTLRRLLSIISGRRKVRCGAERGSGWSGAEWLGHARLTEAVMLMLTIAAVELSC